MSSSAPQFTGRQTQIHERRAHPRVLPRTLIYVACGESNGGMVLNVSDDGMAISMAIPVGDEGYSNLHVRMNGLSQSVEVHGRMAWTSKSKKRAGIQLVDVSEEQRRQIHEWLAREGVRDINLLPRVSESAAPILPPLTDAAAGSRLADEPRPDQSLVTASPATNPALVADPRTSLLAGFGGTPPEFLGPAQDEPTQGEPPSTEDAIAETPSPQGYNPNFAGFRENEWDLASVTMVPRKRSKPEGLSALGLLLLWIAIPSFGIGIIVGGRPLQRWLSDAYAVRKNTSHVATPGPQIVNARDESREIPSSDIDASGSQSIHTVEIPAPSNSLDIKTSAATKSFVSTPAFVDTKLLNSMSTQEFHAMRSPATTTPRESSNVTEVSKSNSNATPNIVAKDVSSFPVGAKPVTRSGIPAVSANAPTNAGNSSTRSGNARDKSIAPPIVHNTQSASANEGPHVQGFSKQSPTGQISRSRPVDSDVNTAATNHPSVAASNVMTPRSSVSNVSSTQVPLKTSSSPAPGTTAAATENYSATHQNTSGSRPVPQSIANRSTASTQSADHSVAPISGTPGNSTPSSSVNDPSRNNDAILTALRTQPAVASSTATTSGPVSSRPTPNIATDTARRNAPNAKPNTASTATAGATTRPASAVYPSGSPRSATPAAFSNVAPVNAQPPLHGLMLVARKNNESFLLRLPVEAVAGGRSVSVQMQRFVRVPAESRWHRHGPIAKLAIGELLTQVAPNQAETAANARPGDAVTVRAFVDKNGSVEDLKPVSGRFALMPRVMHDVREWQFDQTLVDGKPVESEVNITVEFRASSGPQPSRSREIQAQNSFKP